MMAPLGLVYMSFLATFMFAMALKRAENTRCAPWSEVLLTVSPGFYFILSVNSSLILFVLISSPLLLCSYCLTEYMSP